MLATEAFAPISLALLPSTWFADHGQIVLILISVVTMVILIKGADFLVEGASGLAYRIGMPKVIIGATIVSLGTTSPETAVSVAAAWSGQPGLALGNAVGSIIADTALIFGIGCLLAPLPADRFVLSRQGWVQFGSAMILAAICYGLFFANGADASISRPIGIIFLGLLVWYLWISVRWAKQHRRGEPFQMTEDVAEVADVAAIGPETEAKREEEKVHGVMFLLGMIVLGLALVIVSSDALVQSVSGLARIWGVPEVVIASTLVAIGTSLPELVVGITAVRKRHGELLVGNVIGADVLNVLFVIGASAVAAPLPIIDPEAKLPEVFLYVQVPTMLLVLLLFRGYIFAATKKGQFSKWMGWPLVLIYVGFLIASYAVSR